MLASKLIRKYVIISACTFVLASVRQSPGKQVVTLAAGEDAAETGCIVCMDVHGDEADLFICPGSGTVPHALHRECLVKSFQAMEDMKDEGCEKACPLCRKNWKELCIDIRNKAVEDFLMDCTECKDAPESLKDILAQTPNAAHTLNAEEVKGVLLQVVGRFEELAEIHKQL